ncbi:Myosin heavy chain-related [Quillaja saponaria]|uniref:Myosin heavy chain-related n=1 Tax=Quillaja saponaria TaxID=32244 RepID=A0AAD7QDD9_QUISA|nr:Myosin heavy chain-related [Quillaja saponaria]
MQNTKKEALEFQANEAERKMQELNLKLRKLQKVSDEQKTITNRAEQALQAAESYILTYWNNCGKPALDAAVRKIFEKSGRVQTHAAMCFEKVKTEWIPILSEKWETFVSYFEPHVESLTGKSFELYYASKSSLASHFIEVQKVATPLIKKAQMFAEPYINQVDVVTKPYLEKAHVTLKPYTIKIVHSYRRFLESCNFVPLSGPTIS